MLPPFLRIILDEPRLIAGHIDAYASLFHHDLDLWQTRLERRLLLKVLLGVSLFLTIIFSGIALMLWGVGASGDNDWLLIVVPVAPLLLTAIVGVMVSGIDKGRKPFAASRRQLCADLRMLKGDV